MTTEATKVLFAAIKYAAAKHGGRSGGWKQAHQLDAIMYAIADENGANVKEYDGTPLREIINKLCNASATRQQLETQGVIDKSTAPKGSRVKLFAGFDLDEDEQTPDNAPA
jgi:hypothetical protein